MGEGGATRLRLVVVVLAVVALGIGILVYVQSVRSRALTVGFIYDNDETTPYSYDFYLAQKALQDTYGGRVKVLMQSNVLEEDFDASVGELVAGGCDIIFTNCYGNVRRWAREHPGIEFCQVSNDPYPDDEARPNYHTFKGEIYQGRYISGVVAGLKLRQMIDEGEIRPDQALVGFVAAFPYPEVISGYSAFILGVRSQVPEARMHVAYTESWGSFTLEKACAHDLLEKGCLVISQHSDTVGPAIACEEVYSHKVFHVAYNIDMTDVAPNTSLTGTRIDWAPYVLGAVEAVMRGKPIEEVVDGRVHSKNDMSAGLDRGWVRLTDLNERLVAPHTAEVVERVSEELVAGERHVFSGDYRGVSATDPTKTVDLREPFQENAASSIPEFDYILQDVVFVGDTDGA